MNFVLWMKNNVLRLKMKIPEKQMIVGIINCIDSAVKKANSAWISAREKIIVYRAWSFRRYKRMMHSFNFVKILFIIIIFYPCLNVFCLFENQRAINEILQRCFWKALSKAFWASVYTARTGQCSTAPRLQKQSGSTAVEFCFFIHCTHNILESNLRSFPRKKISAVYSWARFYQFFNNWRFFYRYW